MNESSPDVMTADQEGDKFAARLRRFGPLGILAILVILGGNLIIPPLSALHVLIWVKLSNISWHEIGYVQPRNWPKTIALGIVFGVALKFMMKALVMPLFGAPPINQAYQFVTGNSSMIPLMLFTMIVTAGFGGGKTLTGRAFVGLGKI